MSSSVEKMTRITHSPRAGGRIGGRYDCESVCSSARSTMAQSEAVLVAVGNRKSTGPTRAKWYGRQDSLRRGHTRIYSGGGGGGKLINAE